LLETSDQLFDQIFDFDDQIKNALEKKPMKKEIFVLIFLPLLSLFLNFSSLTFQSPNREVGFEKIVSQIAHQACVCFFMQNRNQVDCIDSAGKPEISALIVFNSEIQSATVSFSSWTSIAKYKDGLCALTQD
jgi:hypothetical protein